MSKHGPSSTSVRLALVAIAACAANSQTQAWPSQQLIAERAGLSERQVKRLLKEAEELGWVGRTQAKKPGRAWQYTVYGFCVPQRLQSEIPEHPWDKDPAYRRGDIRDTLSPDKGTSALDKGTEAPSDKGTNGVDKGTQLCPIKSPSEVPKSEVPIHGAPRRTSRVNAGAINEQSEEVQRARQQARELVDRIKSEKAVPP